MLDFYDHNSGIDYPLVSAPRITVGTATLHPAVLLDAGFVFYSEPDEVTLSRVAVSSGTVAFEFLCGSTRLTFVTTGPGVYRTKTTGGDGFIVVGGGYDMLAGMSPTQYPVRNAVVEPARAQFLLEPWVTSVDLANRRTGDGQYIATGITGDLTFGVDAGCYVALDAEANAVVIGSDPGFRRPCYPVEEVDSPCAGFIHAVNGYIAGDDGKFRIAGGPGVKVTNYPDDHRIVVDFSRGFSDGSCAP